MTATLPPSTRPPGMSEVGLARVIIELRHVVGAAQVLAVDDLSGYLDPYAFTAEGEHLPAAAVLVDSVGQIQEVLRIANDHRVPLWTVSRGRNLGYGGASPRVTGSVVLDLSRMNRVLEVDEQAGCALVEPGVSFSDLHQHLRDQGSSLWVSVPDLSWGSVVGNALERGFGYTAYGNHAEQVCGLEVVLADGQVSGPGWAR